MSNRRGSRAGRSQGRSFRNLVLELMAIALFAWFMWVVIRPIATDYLVTGVQHAMQSTVPGSAVPSP